MTIKDPEWIKIAKSYIGIAEIPGKVTAPMIQQWLINLKAWWRDDETPWCGVFVGQVCMESGIALPKNWYRALGWLEWGIPIATPVYGCVVVYQRPGGGHVGFALGVDDNGRILTLGGNQGNRVGMAWIDGTRAVGFRLPPAYLSATAALPVFSNSTGVEVSKNEA